jgi:possible integral membrane protein
MISKTSDSCKAPTVGEASTFLAEYASWLLGCGATCIRIEKNVGRIARTLGFDVEITVMPASVSLLLWDAESGEERLAARRIHRCGINFGLNVRLSRLSWDIADRQCSFAEAGRRFREIVAMPPTGPREVLLLASAANAAFCRLFGGDGAAMLTVLLSTLAGYRLKQIMVAGGRDLRLTFVCASFFSASMSAAGSVFGFGTTPEIAVGTSVLYLIPGVPYINAVSDMIDGHYLCAFSRFVDAAILTACLSAGLCVGMLLLGLDWF